MIMGFDHLTLSVVDLDAKIAALQQNGYQVRFLQKIVNHTKKQPLLACYQPEHTLALLIPPTKNGIVQELTCHGNRLAQPPGPYRPDPAHPNGIILQTTSIEVESQFWSSALGFHARESGVLTLKRPVAAWSCRLTLEAKETLPYAMLDAQGYPCLALTTSNLESDLERVIQANALEATAPFAVEIHQRLMQIALFRTPSGALCELIQLPQRS